MLEQLDLWRQQEAAAPQRHGSARAYLKRLEPLAAQLPVWRDELYLELHRGCATSRPDQKRHNRSLERLLREAELAQALATALASLEAGGQSTAGAAAGAEAEPTPVDPGGDGVGGAGPGFRAAPAEPMPLVDWRPLLFQQFHDILPGTAIPEVFEQAEPIWRASRRRARRQRDAALAALLGLEIAAKAVGDRAAPEAHATPTPTLSPGSLLAATTPAATTLEATTPAETTPAATIPAVTIPAVTAIGTAATQERAAPASATASVTASAPAPASAPATAAQHAPGNAAQYAPENAAQPAPGHAAQPAPGPAEGSSRRGHGAGPRRQPSAPGPQTWVVAQLLPLAAQPRTLRLPSGSWWLASAAGPRPLPQQPAAAGGCWVQLPGLAGVSSLTLQRSPGPAAATAVPAGPAARSGERALAAPGPGAVSPWEPIAPVRLEPMDGAEGRRWCLRNDHLAVSLGPEGIEQLHDRTGRPLLAAPLRWRRWRDAGEFWDAWDLAADHREHPLPWDWDREPQWLERGPLCGHVVWRGRCGRSAARLDARLQAGSPWLELVVSLEWRQRHELLQLELPLAQPACRWASDTAGGVIERAAEPRTAAERARWEVACLSWIAALASPQAGDTPDLAVLLDGPQGVSATSERLCVSLLRAPTWPDPGADNGWQRQRLALMPSPGGWRAAAVPTQARRLREPLWTRPVAAPPRRDGPLLPPLEVDLELVQLRPFPGGPGQLLLAVQNNGPCRRRLDLGGSWQLLERLDGLGQALEPQPEDPAALGPWQLGFWRARASPLGG
jgi:hypothetical protein